MSKYLQGPIPYLGGKASPRIRKALLEAFPPHTHYVEVFGGGGHMLMAKQPVPFEVYNDIDWNLSNLFYVLADDGLFDEFYERVTLLPVSNNLWHMYKRDCLEAGAENVPREQRPQRAALWFYVAALSFSGAWGAAFGRVLGTRNDGKQATVSRWSSRLARLPQIHKRLSHVLVDNSDWRQCIKRFAHQEHGGLVYCDPPYMHGTRKLGRAVYSNEMSDDDHRELLETLVKLPDAVVLSGYEHEMYDSILGNAGWSKRTVDVCCYSQNTDYQKRNAGTKATRRQEIIWINPETVARLGHLPGMA